MIVRYVYSLRYEPAKTRIIRKFDRLGITQEDPRNYSAVHGNSLLDPEQLLARIRELGITDDLVCYFFEKRFE